MSVARIARIASGALLVGWGAAVVVIAVTRAAGAGPSAHALASTPRRIWDGELWTLLTSGLPVSGIVVPEIIAAAATLVLAWRAVGPVLLALAALVAHLGSALIVYAGIGLIDLVSAETVHDVLDRHDYGISAVWLAAVGTLVAVLQRRRPRAALALVALATAASLAVIPVSGPLASPEHILSLAIGWAVTRRGLRHLSIS